MIFLDKPYVSEFLLDNINKNAFPVVNTDSFSNLNITTPLNVLAEDQAIRRSFYLDSCPMTTFLSKITTFLSKMTTIMSNFKNYNILFLYCSGVSPAYFLNIAINGLACLYLRVRATSFTDSPFFNSVIECRYRARIRHSVKLIPSSL